MGSKKLCGWSSSRIREKQKKLHKLISKPRYYCASCARASSDKETLCSPKSIDG